MNKTERELIVTYSLLTCNEKLAQYHMYQSGTNSIEDFIKDIKFEIDNPPNKGDQNGFIPASFKGERLKENINPINMLVLDIDKVKHEDITYGKLVDLLCKNPYISIIYPTASCNSKVSCLRAIIFLATPISLSNSKEISAYKSAFKKFEATFPVEIQKYFDKSQKDINRFFYCYYKIDTHEKKHQFFDLTKISKLLELNDYLDTSNISDTKKESELEELDSYVKQQPLNITDKEAKELLFSIDIESTDNHLWFQILCAVAHQFQGREEGFTLFNLWSSGDSRIGQYKGETAIKKEYDRVSKNQKEVVNPITFATVISIVKEQKLKNSESKLETEIVKMKGSILDIIADKSKIIIPELLPLPKITTKADGTIKLSILSNLENFKYILKHFDIELKHDEITLTHYIFFKGEQIGPLKNLLSEIKSLLITNGFDKYLIREYANQIAFTNTFNSFKDYILTIAYNSNEVNPLTHLYQTLEVEDSYKTIRDRWITLFLYKLIDLTCFNDEPESPKHSNIVLILKGDQGVGKTEWFRYLIPKPYQKSWFFGGSKLNLNKEMDKLKCITKVIAELGEISATFKVSDQEDMKNFITAAYDSIDKKYIDEPIEYPRKTMFTGTENHQKFLKDITGNRRYFVIPVLKCNPFHNLDMQQIYRFIYNEISEGRMIEYNTQDYSMQKELNKEFEFDDPLEEHFLETYDLNKPLIRKLQCRAIAKEMGYTDLQITFGKGSLTNRISRICKKLNLNFNSKHNTYSLPEKNFVDFNNC